MKTKKRVLSFLLAIALVVGMFPCTALAEDEKALSVSIDDCVQIGTTEDDEAVYLYTAENYAGETKISFPDLSITEDGMIASFGNASVEGVNEAPISPEYLAGEGFVEHFEFSLYEDYEEYDFSDMYGYWVMDDDYEMYYFIVKIPKNEADDDLKAPFTPSVGKITDIKENAYLYDDWSGSAVNADLYTVTVPFGTQNEEFTFTDDRIAYGYNEIGGYIYSCSEKENGYEQSGQVGEKKAKVRLTEKGEMPGYIIVQTPYVVEGDNWSSDTLYAVKFECTYSFTAKAGDANLNEIAYIKNGYVCDANFSDGDYTADTPIALYTITVPDGTEEVSLSFSKNVIAYNYSAEGAFISGWYDDFYTGANTATVPVDSDKNGEFDVIQVQTPYDSAWNSDVLYGITFAYESGGNPPAAPLTKGKYTAEELAASLASQYAKNGVENDSTYPWIAADMAAYGKTYPDTKYVFNDEQKKIIADKTISMITNDSASAGDLSKGILALCAMGFDPCDITTSDGTEFDAVDKLLSIAFKDEDREAVSDAVMSEYTLPWVISAIWQFGDTYKDELNALVDAEVEMIYDSEEDSCELSFAWGPDGASFVLMTIGPFYGKNNDVTKAIDAMKKELKKEGAVSFNEDGAVTSWGSDSPESTAILIAGLAAVGEDPDEFFDVVDKQSGKKTADIDLSKGLLSLQNADSTGFKSSYGVQTTNEQGFRGLIALVNMEDKDSYVLYDFDTDNLKPVSSLNAGVSIKVIPENAKVEIVDENKEAVAPVKEGSGIYELEEGDYTYTVSLDGYTEKTGTVKITAEDVEKRARQDITVSLTKAPSDNKKENINVTVKVLSHKADDACRDLEGTTTYKNDAKKYESVFDEDSYTVQLPKGATARDALVTILDSEKVSYVEESNGYFSEIANYAEFDHGPNSGWMYMVNKVTPDVAAGQYTLKDRDSIIWYYTDDFTNDMGAEKINSSGNKEEGEDTPDTAKKFVDVADDAYYAKAVDWAVKNGVTTGTTETTFSPDKGCTRAQAVTFLWRAAGSPEVKADVAFTDVKKDSYYEKAVAWAVAKGITSGTTETTFSPDADCTRAQIVTFMSRMEGKDNSAAAASFKDVPKGSYYEGAVGWASEKGITTGTTETTFSPDADCTRAQIVTFLYRYISLK